MSQWTKTDPQTDASDIAAESWLFRLTPNAFRPYLNLARVDRPIGTWLLLLPCWWGLALASRGDFVQSLYFGALFTVGAFVMRGAGCVWNDILDRNYDAQVARTAQRPIASGDVSVREATLFMAGLAGVGLLVLVQFNGFTMAIAVAALGLVALYPLMKRFTYWPQAWLGLTFNWGSLVGWAAVNGSLDAPVYYLYAAGFFWTLGYDTIYAHQDKEDDALVGVRSTALLFGDETRVWLAGFYLAALTMFIAAGFRAELNYVYYIGVGFGALHFVWQIFRLDADDPQDCLAKFKSNKWIGILITATIVAGQSW
ncbi:MAG: 4-hydroxybenzoate octaprenyltransferase [Rhodospirillaceae bacterium]|nr:4-hydroxybenzoate octaprenyltransferase [Rhodospirillaceae bacterium]OUX27798.1 MAG: 4-hydroxybenzoate polyprenyltransferase [Rhodospirillaceae bacterium TMED256]